ncbi:hypothetical protein Glove_759g4 [Diversispora epigaea]|uniref:Uncharacterized protein n=1 Tax=Diversispora epigaea TaxID=1348612 RepID=A0A397FZ85_9GLOM|nr:hypothetical protein Glove_759g4 [Diversispora epigaea]
MTYFISSLNANQWHEYFDENDTKLWNAIEFHENWCRIHEGDPEKLPYSSAKDTFSKSLRAIANKCPDVEKVPLDNDND